MAHFKGTVKGSRGAVSRLGGKEAGITTKANGWNVGIAVYGRVNKDGEDEFTIYRTRGSSGGDTVKLATVTEGKITIEHPGGDGHTLNREDFNVLATSRGYQIQYKGQNIGGAGISEGVQGPRGRQATAQVDDYLRNGKSSIEQILSGNGETRFLNEIARINIDLVTKAAGIEGGA